MKYIKRCKDSACGTNGIPYSAYRACPEIAADVFVSQLFVMTSENKPNNLESFNKQVVWFAPKGTHCEDNKQVIRTPDKLRTIFGSNSDSKIVSGAIGCCIQDATLEVTPPMQRGFCFGRQLGLNVVDLDAYMRAFNARFDWDKVKNNIPHMPCTMLYDFCNAFPTLLHTWLFMVLRALGVPSNIYNIIWWLYTNITAYSSGTGDGSLIFLVKGGVKTGCPLSSLLFLLGSNPLVDMFKLLTDGPKLSVTRLCADDIGSVLSELRWFKRQASIFNLAAKIAGLHLKEIKCVLIVSGCELTPDIIHGIRMWLRKHTPSF